MPTHTDTWLLLGILPFLTATDMCEPDPVTTHDGEVLVANAPLTFADAVSIDGADRTPFSPASSHSTSIVEAYSGQIGMTSAPGEGLTFWVTIPKIEMRTMSN